MKIQQIHPDHIIESDINPRLEFEEIELCDLAQSIVRVGLIEPVVLRPQNGGCFEIVAGHRRVRAWKLAREQYGLTQLEIPSQIVENKTEGEIIEIRLIENLQRKDLKPHEEAEGVKRLIQLENDKCELVYPTNGALAKALGKSESWVRDRLNIATLAEKTKCDLDKLPTDIARKIARLPAEIQVEIIEDFLDKKSQDVKVKDIDLLEEVFDEKGTSSHEFFFDINETIGGVGPCARCKWWTGRCLNGDECYEKKNKAAEQIARVDCANQVEDIKKQFPNATVIFDSANYYAVKLNCKINDIHQSHRLREMVRDDLSVTKKRAPVAGAFISPDAKLEIIAEMDVDSLRYIDVNGKTKNRAPKFDMFVEFDEYKKLASETLTLSYADYFKAGTKSANTETPKEKEKRLTALQKTKIANARRELQNADMCAARAKCVFTFALTPMTTALAAAEICHDLIHRGYDKEGQKRAYAALCAALKVQPDSGVDWVEQRHINEAFKFAGEMPVEKLFRVCYLPLAFHGCADYSHNDPKESSFPIDTYKKMRDKTDKKWDEWEGSQLDTWKNLRKGKK